MTFRWRQAAMIAGVLVIVVALYAYFVRPYVADTSVSYNYWYGGHAIPNVEPYNLVRLGWYLSPLGIVLAVAGVWRALRHELTVPMTFFLAVGLFFSFLYLYRSYNNPHHIYVMRRYVPVVIPFFVTMAALALEPWFEQAGYLRWVGGGVAVVFGGWLLFNARIVLPHVEYRGASHQFQVLTEALGDSAQTIILFNDDLPVSSGAQVGMPLHYLYDYTVFDVQESIADSELLMAQIARWQVDGWRVLLAEGAHHSETFLSNLSLQFVTDFAFDVPVLEVSYEHAPREIWQQSIPVRVYEIAPLR